MRTRLKAAIAIAFFPVSVCAEDFTCTYHWAGKTENHPIFIEVKGGVAIIRGGYLNSEFRVIENSQNELIVVQTNTKRNSGKDYPVGASLIVVDKATRKMVRSNTHTDESFNSHAIGNCSIVLK